MTWALSLFFAEWLIWAIPLLIGVGWLCGHEPTRKTLLIATASGVLGLLTSQLVSLLWWHPRPFMIGLGHTLIPHAADASFPSDHLTLWWAVAFSLLRQRTHRRLGLGLSLLGLPIAWARIYLGVHFPIDMLGAIGVAVCASWLATRGTRCYLERSYQLALYIHHRCFGK